MTLFDEFDELYDLKTNEPIDITLEKLLETEFELDKKIKELSGQDESNSRSSYLRCKHMVNNLTFKFESIS